MKIYTVHARKLRDSDAEADPERFRFVRDGFYFWAFLLGPVWMLWHGLWLVLLIYALGLAALTVGLTVLGISSAVQFIVGFLVAVLIGCEAGSLRRFGLRRRWTQVGVVAGRDLEEAERRFFEAWPGGVSSAPFGTSRTSWAPMAQSSPEVLGLFPQPEPRR